MKLNRRGKYYFDGSNYKASTWKELLIGIIESILSKHELKRIERSN